MKKIILISLAAILFAGVGGYLGCYFSYNNQEITPLEHRPKAQRGKVEGVHDKMWKVLQQKAQVSNEYKDAFTEIYPANYGGTLFEWRGTAFMDEMGD